MLYPIGMSTGGLTPTREIMEDYARAGITHMEISVGNEDFDALDLCDVRTWADACGVTLWSMHLPFAPFTLLDPSSTDEGKRTFTVTRFKELMARGTAAGIGRFVVHASAEPIPDEERPARMAAAKKSMAELADYAASLGGVVCVEDLPRTCLGHDSGEILELLSADPRLICCCDTNHLLTEALPAFIRAVGGRIGTLHVSDYDNINERHWLPGEGCIDWPETIAALRETGYGGVWMYEIGLDCPWSIIRPRDLTRDDFARNAQEIMEGRPITVISTPKPGIGMWG